MYQCWVITYFKYGTKKDAGQVFAPAELYFLLKNLILLVISDV
jgi:hypothetical protein